MKHCGFLIAFLYCMGADLLGVGQMHRAAIPYSVEFNLPATNTCVDLFSSKETSSVSGPNTNEAFRFAHSIDTQLTPNNSGQWSHCSKGKIWRLRIHSPNAQSIYLVMQYQLLPGAKVFFYSPDYQVIQGAFNSFDNQKSRIMSIAPITGEELIIEINLPDTQSNWGEFEITKVFHAFRPITDTNLSSTSTQRQIRNCSEDINCENGIFWQTEKRSVCKVIYNGMLGTGVLMANTSSSGTPYLLTAEHLIPNQEAAAEALFQFNYESQDCNSSSITSARNVFGSTLLATTDHQLDFALVQLNTMPPEIIQPYYAGWNALDTPPQSGASIHHPMGGVKEIAISYTELTGENIGQGYDDHSTWKVKQWDIGTTESGSSGAPFFDQQHRVVGSLAGGRATCGYTRDDYFTRLSVAWDKYSSPEKQLKHWLDPTHSGQLVMDGYDPYGFHSAHCDTAWNFDDTENLTLIEQGMSWGSATGHNSERHSQFAEKFVPSSNLKINGVYLHVAKAKAVNALAHLRIKIWIGESHPEQEIYSQISFLDELNEGQVNYLALDKTLNLNQPFFVGYEIEYLQESDTLALYQSLRPVDNSSPTYFVFQNEWHPFSSPDTGLQSHLGIGLSACYGKIRKPDKLALNLYPNPTERNFVTIELPERQVASSVQCFNSRGQPVPIRYVASEIENKIYFDLKDGIYFLNVNSGGRRYVSRLVVSQNELTH